MRGVVSSGTSATLGAVIHFTVTVSGFESRKGRSSHPGPVESADFHPQFRKVGDGFTVDAGNDVTGFDACFTAADWGNTSLTKAPAGRRQLKAFAISAVISVPLIPSWPRLTRQTGSAAVQGPSPITGDSKANTDIAAVEARIAVFRPISSH